MAGDDLGRLRGMIQSTAKFALRADGNGNVRWQRRPALGALSFCIQRAAKSERIGLRLVVRLFLHSDAVEERTGAGGIGVRERGRARRFWWC